MSYELQVEGLKVRVEIQKYSNLRVTGSNTRAQIHKLRVQLRELRVQVHELYIQITSCGFKFMSSKIIKLMKTQVNSVTN